MEAKLFYQEFGRLLYAIAAADGSIAQEEVATLKKIVSEQLVPQEVTTDQFGTDQAFITEFEFDVLADRSASAEGAFDSFIAYMSRHHNDLSPQRKDLILKAAGAVARAFHGRDQNELPMLRDLRKYLG